MERSRRANRAETLRILDRAGKGNSPMEGDELASSAEHGRQASATFGRTTPQSGKFKKRRKKTKIR